MKKHFFLLAALAISAFAFADNKTETFEQDDIAALNATAHNYADDPWTFNGTELQYEAACKANKDVPWLQLRDNAGTSNPAAYIKIKAPGKIVSVALTVTSASNSSGGQSDITKHTAFDTSKGKLMLRTALDGDTLVASNAVTNNAITLTVPDGEAKTLYLQSVKVGCRIWGWTITYEEGGGIEVKHVESVALNVHEKTMSVYETLELTAEITPKDADNKKVTWTSSDEDVATVSEKGFVRAIGVGKANIVVKSEDGEKTDTCKLTVEAAKKSEYILIAPDALKDKDTVIITMTIDSVGIPMLLSNAEKTDKGPKAIEGGFLDGSIVPASKEVSFVALIENDSITFVPVDGEEGVILYTTEDNAGVKVAKPSATTQGGFKWIYDEETGYLKTTYVYVKKKGTAEETSETITRFLGVYNGEWHAYVRSATMIEKGTMPTNIKDEHLAFFVKGATIVHPESVELDKHEATLKAGSTLQLTATVKPDNALDKLVEWKSLNAAIATVDENGLVTAVAEGSTSIVVITEDGDKTDTCKVKVEKPAVPVTGVTLDKNDAELKVGATLQLTATVAPANADVKDVEWSTSDEKIATVSATGLVTAVAKGEATITVKTKDSGKTATCKVKVVEEEQGIENLIANPELNGKIMHQGQLYIIRDGKMYNVTGARVQ